MTSQKKAASAAQPVAAAKPPKKLIPRHAPRAEVIAEAVASEAPPVLAPVAPVPEAVAPPAATPATAAATARARPPRKPSQEDETVARHQKVLAEALAMAQAINYDQPQVMRPPEDKGRKAAKPAKPAKAKKLKLVRDSYAMPEAEYAQIDELKQRLLAMDSPAKKSELLRGGIVALSALNDAELKAMMARVERIKTGRPAK